MFINDSPSIDPPKLLTKEEVLLKTKDPSVVLVNVLPEKDFEKLHIKDSQSLALGQNIRGFGIQAKKKFAKGTHLITYGADKESSLGLNAAKILVGSGFHADHYPGGLQEWIKAGLPTESTDKVPAPPMELTKTKKK